MLGRSRCTHFVGLYEILKAGGVRRVHTSKVDTHSVSDSTIVARPAHVLYDLISDVTRMTEWSPVTKESWWDDGNGPHVGAWFTARNEIPNRTGDTRSQWERRCAVTVANRGREFTYIVAGSWIEWSFTFTDDRAGGTRVTETGRFLPQGIVSFHERYGDEADAQIGIRIEAARKGVAEALAGIKRLAEAK